MKLTDLLGQQNIQLLEMVLRKNSQTVLFQTSGQSEIELAFSWLSDRIQQDGHEVQAITPEDGKIIKIEAARQIITQTIISPRTRRYFLIFAADKMPINTQNALLKELEEPGKNRFFFLFTNQADLLLSTIRSRCQKTNLLGIDETAIRAYFAKTHPNTPNEKLNQIAFMANRSIERWQELLDDPQEFERSSQLAALAKQVISANIYQKITIINRVSTTREQAIEFVNLVLKIQAHLLAKQPSQMKVHQTDRWLRSLDLLQHNSSLKLGLMAAVL